LARFQVTTSWKATLKNAETSALSLIFSRRYFSPLEAGFLPPDPLGSTARLIVQDLDSHTKEIRVVRSPERLTQALLPPRISGWTAQGWLTPRRRRW
jgi:hypothetical protein